MIKHLVNQVGNHRVKLKVWGQSDLISHEIIIDLFNSFWIQHTQGIEQQAWRGNDILRPT